MEKLIEVGNQQIENLVKMQNDACIEDAIEIDNNIREWVKVIKDCKVAENGTKASKEFIDKLGRNLI